MTATLSRQIKRASPSTFRHTDGASGVSQSISQAAAKKRGLGG